MKKLMIGLAAAAVAVGAWAATEKVGNYTWTYRINDGTAEIYGNYWNYEAAISPKPTGAVKIPSKLGGKPVASIGNYAFYDCSSLKSVTIPRNVTNIGVGAFWDCSRLASVTIPDSVESIGSTAFRGCSGLTSVYITDLAKWCRISFADNLANPFGKATDIYLNGEKITDLVIPDGVTSVGASAFSGCSGFASVAIPDSVTSIGSSAFSGCSGLTDVTIPGSVTNIGSSAFSGCSGLAGVTIPASVTSIGSSAFSGCSGLTGVTIPDSVTRIGSSAFSGCSGLTGVTIPDSVTSIGSSAFSGCNGLTSVTIPGSVTNIGGSAFYNCTNVTDVVVPGWQCTIPFGAVTKLIISDGATSIRSSAFFGCSELTSVTIPDSVTNIGGSAFYGCGGLTSVTLPWSLLPEVFSSTLSTNGWKLLSKDLDGTEEYQSAAIGNSASTFMSLMLKGPYDLMFSWKVSSESGNDYLRWYLDETEKSKISGPGGTWQNVSVSIPAGEHTIRWTYSKDGSMTSGSDCGWVRVPKVGLAGGLAGLFPDSCAMLQSVTITGSTTEIPAFAFEGCSALSAIDIPSAVTSIGDWAFCDCSGLKSVLIPCSVTRIGDGAFNGCSGLTSVSIGNGVTEIGDAAFAGCISLASLKLPSALCEFGLDALPSKIKESLVYDTNGFKIYNGWVLDYQNRSDSVVTIPEGIVGIGRGAFAAMYDLETVTMPESLKYIASGAFEDCSWIQNLQFMSGLRYVGPVAFRGCSSLLGASFADGLEHLGTNVFESCWNMKSVRLPYTVTNIGDNAFTGCSAIRGVTVPTHLKTMQALFPASYSKIETAEVAEGETTVMDDMFKGCVALRGGATQTDMSMIPNTVTNIGARAFQGCSSLTAFVVPDSVVKIGASVFQGCTELWNVTLSRSLTKIPDYAFYGCSMLETMVVPENVSYLGNRFFSGRTNPIQGQVIENALYYLCANAPEYHASAYAAISGNMTTYVLQNSRSWDGRQGSRVLPQSWNGYAITYWTPNRFDVTFDANGGQFDSMGGSTWSEQQITDTTYALPSTEPVRPGWAFEGWWMEQTGGAEVRYTTLVTATRPHTIYAHWRSLGNKMTVTYNSNGGTVVTPGTQDYVPGQTFGQFPVPTRRGYDFQGWWTEAVNGTRMTEATQVPAADMELFAHWAPITYYVRFHANGGTGTMTDQLFVFDVQQALKTHAFTRTGFAFTDWATTPIGQVRYAENKTVVNLEEVEGHIVDLYAVWSGVGYSVRFDSNGGTGVMDNQTIAVGETQNLWPCAFARGGYTFAGWAVSPTDAEAKRVTYLDGEAVRDLATSNGAVVPLYAVWVTGSQTVRITFDANGGSVAPNDYWDCVVGTAVEAFPTPTRPGFTFVGWFSAAIGGTQVASIARVTAAQTFYAHWTENGSVVPGDGSCTVTFNANGGSVTETTRKVGEKSAVGALPTPMRTGYSFVGWFSAATGGSQISAWTVVTSDVTYYAHWTWGAESVEADSAGGLAGGGTSAGGSPSSENLFDGSSLELGVVVQDRSYVKAQSAPGVLCDADGALAGAVQMSVGKKNKNNQVKVSASVTTMNGKAVKSKAVTIKLPEGSDVTRGTLVFKSPIGSMDFTIDAAGNITLEGGSGVLASAKVGGNLPNGKMAFAVDIDALPAVDAGFAVLDDLLPDGVEVTVTGGKKLDAGKAATLKYAKDKASGQVSLVGLDDPKKPNLSGLKLTYTPKTGVFKGSFNMYATNEGTVPAPKLKKYRVTVTGFIVNDGTGPRGVGEATMKKPAAKWSVTIK